MPAKLHCLASMVNPPLETEIDRDRLAELAARWETVPRPIRLGPDDIGLYDRALKAELLDEGTGVLLLGSTPELRSLVARHGHRITGADIDAVFWKAMSLLCSARGPESFIAGDWLALPRSPAWRVILADDALNMLAWADMQVMIARLANMLTPNGVFITRTQAQNPDVDLETLAEAVEDWQGPRTTRAFIFAQHCLVESLRSALRPELSNRGFYEAVVAPMLSPAEMDALRPFLRDRPNFYPPLDALCSAFGAHFEIIEQVRCAIPAAWGTQHFFVLRPKAAAQRAESTS